MMIAIEHIYEEFAFELPTQKIQWVRKFLGFLLLMMQDSILMTG